MNLRRFCLTKTVLTPTITQRAQRIKAGWQTVFDKNPYWGIEEQPTQRLIGPNKDELAFCAAAKIFDWTSELTVPTQPSGVGTVAMLNKDLQAFGRRGESKAIAEFFDLVLRGTILTRHVFKGLRRELFTDGDRNADKQMFVYTRKPAFDVVWIRPGNRWERIDPPKGNVFAVIVRPNIKHRDRYPEIDGWINAWPWVDEDAGLAEAPEDWVDRYDLKLWTREGG